MSALHRTGGPRVLRARRPIVINAKIPARVRRGVAAGLARQERARKEDLLLRVGDDWAGRGRRTPMVLPEELRAEPEAASTEREVLRPMPRREASRANSSSVSYALPPLRLETPQKVGFLAVFARLLVWIRALLSFQLGSLKDRVRGRDSLDRRAIRLRETFESVGGTFVKVGQQMASRLDLLPQRYCEELGLMFDRYPPFPTQQAIDAIEKTTGEPLAATFSEFDPEPIGSASIAVVYQARLRATGEKVAVKVRRPGIEKLFAVDFAALDLLGDLAELLTLVPPGFTKNIRSEFRDNFSTELDFRREARLGELFRRRAKKRKSNRFTAPRVFSEYSDDGVLVQEFVSGIWLWEILAAVEGRDPAALERMRQLGIEPKTVARRLLHAHNWGLYHHIAFHADPHPANIVVQADSQLVFVDFGAAGYLNHTRKLIFQRSHEAFLAGDIETQAQASIMASEPIPPMDVNSITKELQHKLFDQMLAIKSKSAPWYERTSASMYVATIGIMSRYNLPAPPDILMFARATLLYDTLAARLNPDINYYKEYGRFTKKAARSTAKRAKRAIRRRLSRGLDDRDYAALGSVLDVGGHLLFKAQRLTSIPYDFAVLPFVVDRWAHAIMMVGQAILRAGLVTFAGLGVVMLTDPAIGAAAAADRLLASPVYWVIIGLIVAHRIRLIWFRLGDVKKAEI